MGRLAIHEPLRPLHAALALGLALAVAAGAGCASRPPEGAFHILSEGETVYRLSQIYRVPVTDIIEANAIEDVSDLQPGTRLWIPGAREPDLRELPRTPLPDSERRRHIVHSRASAYPQGPHQTRIHSAL